MMKLFLAFLAVGFVLAIASVCALFIRLRDTESAYDEMFDKFKQADDARRTLEQSIDCLQREYTNRIQEIKKMAVMPKKTNRDKLNSMTNEQFAEWLSAETSHHGYFMPRGYWFDWLRREVNK